MEDHHGNSFMNGVTIVFFLFSFSFLLNFFWEALHAVYLYQHHDFDATTYVPMLFYVSSMDSLMVSFFLILSLVVGFIIEYRAIFYTHRWLYRKTMPTIFGVGLSPLLQLSVTGILAVWLTREILFGKGLLRN